MLALLYLGPMHPQDMGTMVMGKVESGGLAKGMTLTLMPNKVCNNPKCVTFGSHSGKN